MSAASGSSVSVASGSSVSVASGSSVTESGSSTTAYIQGFTIPNKWRPSIMTAIEEKKLSPDIRNEIVRDLVTHMYGFMEKPTSSFCKFVAYVWF